MHASEGFTGSISQSNDFDHLAGCKYYISNLTVRADLTAGGKISSEKGKVLVITKSGCKSVGNTQDDEV